MPKKTTKKNASKTSRKRSSAKSATKATASGFAKPGVSKAKSRGGKLYPPSKIYAQVSPHSIGGVSMFENGMAVNAESAANFTSEESLIQASADKLRDAGFEILQASESTINTVSYTHLTLPTIYSV